MRNTNWIYKSEEMVRFSTKKNKKRDIFLEKILRNRNISTDEEIGKFLHVRKEDIADPFMMIDVEKSVNRILSAIEKKEEIWIYGDYDVDGITSTSLLYVTLKRIGAKVNYYIPLRDEGYGLNKDAIKSIKDADGDLIITVDCGVSSIEEVDYCNSLGLEMIITDHHEINNEIPKAYAVINPKREENTYKFKYLAGVGTAFMLMLALYEKIGKKEEIYDYLDIVAVGTVADIVPLVQENRIFTKLGLKILKNSKFEGLRRLVAKLFPDYMNRKFQGSDIGFGIAPIFNAAGRLEDAKKVVEFLIGPEGVNLNAILIELLDNNYDRKEIQKTIYEKSIRMIEDKKLNENKILILGRKDFHHGVIGIVASKVSEKYYKPAIIYEIKESENIAVASCRSIENFNITDALVKFSDYLLKFGGHSAAAGFTISLDKIEDFKKDFTQYVNNFLSSSQMIKNVKLECQLPMSKITHDFYDALSLLEPYGSENPIPIFSLKNCNYTNLRIIGKTKEHVMLDIVKDNCTIKNCSFFGGSDIFDKLKKEKYIDIAFRLKVDNFKERYYVKLDIVDVKKSKKQILDNIYEIESCYNINFPINCVIYTRKEIDPNSLTLKVEKNEVNIYNGRVIIDTLVGPISQLISRLSQDYNQRFSIVCKEILRNSENYNIHISIDKYNMFETFVMKESLVFKEIKNFLIGEFSFNEIQKNVFRTIFRDRKNAVVYIEEGRGISTIVKTIGLFYQSVNKRAVLVSEHFSDAVKDIFLRDKLINLETSIKLDYDYYVVVNPTKENIENIREMLKSGKKIEFLIINTENVVEYDFNDEFDTVEILRDSYIIPSNLNIVSYENIIEKLSKDKNSLFFLPFLSSKEKARIVGELKSGVRVEGTKDIISRL
ncbi:single-stranded-DNA-specific exonuclease RecJ [Fusobacterium sp. PH5-44]|uniref:single-stranded-DNA-specific exonuclease RecJ n=1 Tax=unclassified Fusobacterium TaxID=2648384 RepID=UPI003D1D0C31